MPLSEALWPQFAKQLGTQSVRTPIWGKECGCRESDLVPHGSR